MELKNRLKSSLSNQVVYLFGISIFFFILGTIILFFIQNEMNDKYIENRERIVHERNLLITINDTYNRMFIDMWSISDFNNEQLKNQLTNKEEEIVRLTAELEDTLANYEQEEENIKIVREFSNDFHTSLLPAFLAIYEEGDMQKLDEFSDKEILPRINSFQDSMLNSIMGVGKHLEKNVKKLSQDQTYVQVAFTLFIIIFLFMLQMIIKRIFKNIGKPLSEFAFAANEIAAGRDAIIETYPQRKDELGSLSIAFQKMIATLQNKEQDLIAHNEELLAQQDELQAGQEQLQETLGIIIENEEKLKRHSALINGISTSLQKSEVLNSIVTNMCKITFSDKGIIALIDEDSYAAFGISETGVQQFKNNLDSGINQRLIESKKAFVIKRGQEVSEKGYHETMSFSYDLYLPVLTNAKLVKAIMVFSRLGHPYSDKEIDEYETLTKQIAISLDKISLYERSEEARILNQDILNTVQEGIQLIDENRNIIQINHQLCELFNRKVKTDDIIGLPWSQWTSNMAEKIVDEQFISTLDKAISSATKGEGEKFIYRLKGDARVIQVYCKRIVNGEKEAGTIIVHRDMTKEYEVDQMKSEFVSTVSHELRTPLASVLGFTELLLHKELKPERKTKYLNTIYNEAKRLSALINDFLDIQRIESGKQTYDIKYIDLRPLWEQVIENQQVQTSIHDIHLMVDTVNTNILGDKEKLQQIFTNFLNNAIKYTPEGGNVTIHLREDEHSLIIDIKDEGLGIPKDAIPHLFEKFYRVDNSDHRKIGGTGLGLSIAGEIVKIHEGTITVDSELGSGSTFTLTFPKVTLNKEVELTQNNSDSNLHHNVVIVEDDLSLADLLFQELVGSGFQVSSFHNGQAALKYIKAFPPDAIVLDIMLGENEVDGWIIMDELKKDDKLKNIPIFISSALDERERGFSVGVQEYLVKPYSPTKLSKVIMQTLLENGKQGQIMIPKKEE